MDFNRRDVLKKGLLVGAGCSLDPALFADDTASVRDRVSEEAERIVRDTRHTKYQHKEYIDEATGTYFVDCSDFVSYVLKRVAKRHLRMIPKESWWPVPRAYKFYRFFAGLPTEAADGWRKIERLEDARRGDMIAWELTGAISKTHDTGHVFVIADTPSSLGDNLMAVRACDSAAMPHYDDTRIGSDGSFHDGVGKGTFHLRVNESGKPVAFQFGSGAHFHEDPIAIGRVLPV